MQDQLFTLPLPILTFLLSAVAAVLVWRRDFGNPLARGLFTTLFVTQSIASLLVGLRFGYGINTFIPLQRIFPILAGPLLFAAFHALTAPRRPVWIAIGLHVLLIPCMILAFIMISRAYPLYDVAIAASYLAYALLIYMLWRKGPDHLTNARLDLAEPLRLWMLLAIGLLVALTLFDSAIALSFAWQREDAALGLISIGAVAMTAGLCAAIFAISRARPAPVPTAAPATDDPLLARAETLLNERSLYLDTSLTVDRLARRLGVPSRALSEAVNGATGLNVSQYVNGFRLRHAARLLVETNDPATQIMEKSGFLTRSNFYREFQRVYGQTPVAYRAGAKG